MARVSTPAIRALASDQRAGLIAMIVAMALLPLGDAISKTLTEIAHPAHVTAWRSWAQTAFFIPVAILFRRRMQGPILSPMSLMSAVLILTVTL